MGGETAVSLMASLREMKSNNERAPYLSRWRHLKSGGNYVVRMHVLLEHTLEPHVVYHKQFAEPFEMWCRPAREFFDGRFERMGT